MSKHQSEEDKNRPPPEEFDRYLPWACSQVQCPAQILVTRIVQNEYVGFGTGDRSKAKKSKARMQSSKTDLSLEEKEEKSCQEFQWSSIVNRVVKICAIYDNSDNLIHIKFDGNRHIPQILMKILGMIVKFQPNLTEITINRGCNASIIHELNKFLPFSNITDVCLDETFIPEANYDLLLGELNSLRQISLARCKLNDAVVKNIASKLIYPMPASKTLSILNLSSNKITDEGAKEIGLILRGNRQVSYLNLADNSLTDTGAEAMLSSLQKFQMNHDEIMAGKARHIAYLKEKKDLINRIVGELKTGDYEMKSSKKKGIRSASITSQKKGKIQKEISINSITDNKDLTKQDYLLFDKAVTIVDNILDDFKDPFSPEDTIFEEGNKYCFGNNTLCVLNLAYNNISYFSLKKLLVVVMYQKCFNRRPRGLINVCIEGNQIPKTCLELKQLDDILDMGLKLQSKRLSTAGMKRSGSKSVK